MQVGYSMEHDWNVGYLKRKCDKPLTLSQNSLVVHTMDLCVCVRALCAHSVPAQLKQLTCASPFEGWTRGWKQGRMGISIVSVHCYFELGDPQAENPVSHEELLRMPAQSLPAARTAFLTRLLQQYTHLLRQYPVITKSVTRLDTFHIYQIYIYTAR